MTRTIVRQWTCEHRLLRDGAVHVLGRGWYLEDGWEERTDYLVNDEGLFYSSERFREEIRRFNGFVCSPLRLSLLLANRPSMQKTHSKSVFGGEVLVTSSVYHLISPTA